MVNVVIRMIQIIRIFMLSRMIEVEVNMLMLIILVEMVIILFITLKWLCFPKKV